MILLIQRVAGARVDIRGREGEPPVGRIGAGLLCFVCGEPEDTEAVVEKAARRVAKLRVFEDEAGKMNRSVVDIGGSVLVVSQFTLAADLASGNRPGFSGAASPEKGRAVCEGFAGALGKLGVPVATGEFAAHMRVTLINDGPATFWLKL